MRKYLMVQKFVFTVAVLGSIALIVILATSSNEEFIATFNTMMTPLMGTETAYSDIVASAAANGWTTEGADWKTTLLVSNWCFLPLIGAAFSIAIAGEIKSVEKSQTYGMLGAVIGTVIIWLITISLANSVFGYDFIGSAIYNFFLDPAAATAPVVAPPTDASITLLAGILTQSSLVTIVVSVGLIAGCGCGSRHAHVRHSRHRRPVVRPGGAGTAGAHSPTRHTPTIASRLCGWSPSSSWRCSASRKPSRRSSS
jgi:hypothetical protein